MIILFIIYLLNIIIFNFSILSASWKKSSSYIMAESESESWYHH